MKITEVADNKRKFQCKEIILDEATVDELLSLNHNNRPGSKCSESNYANEMADGTWCKDNPGSMSFTINESGTRLLDGQTRLEAIKRAGKYGYHALLYIVPDSKEDEIFGTMDQCRRRTTAQNVAARGMEYGKAKSSTVEGLLEALNVKRNSVTKKTDLVEELDPLLQLLPLTRKHEGRKGELPKTFFAGILNAIRLGATDVGEAIQFSWIVAECKGGNWSREKARVLTSNYVKRGKNIRRDVGLFTQLVVWGVNEPSRAGSGHKWEEKSIRFTRGGPNIHAIMLRFNEWKKANPELYSTFTKKVELAGRGGKNVLSGIKVPQVTQDELGLEIPEK
jgi:hypothetical protein